MKGSLPFPFYELLKFTYKSFLPPGYGTGTECDDNCSGTVAAQTYTNTVITLDAADPNFGSTGVASGGATITGLSSSQGGLVWTIASINIPAMVYVLIFIESPNISITFAVCIVPPPPRLRRRLLQLRRLLLLPHQLVPVRSLL